MDEISRPRTKRCLLMHVTFGYRQVLFAAFRKRLRYLAIASAVAMAFNASVLTAVGCAVWGDKILFTFYLFF